MISNIQVCKSNHINACTQFITFLGSINTCELQSAMHYASSNVTGFWKINHFVTFDTSTGIKHCTAQINITVSTAQVHIKNYQKSFEIL